MARCLPFLVGIGIIFCRTGNWNLVNILIHTGGMSGSQWILKRMYFAGDLYKGWIGDGVPPTAIVGCVNTDVPREGGSAQRYDFFTGNNWTDLNNDGPTFHKILIDMLFFTFAKKYFYEYPSPRDSCIFTKQIVNGSSNGESQVHVAHQYLASCIRMFGDYLWWKSTLQTLSFHEVLFI